MRAPATIGRFRVQRPLGSGAFARVWLAEDPQLDALVAVKVLADHWSTNADVHRRFVDEARLLRRVDSDHVVRVYDIGELEDGRPWFVMTYADGGTLAALLDTYPAPWATDDVLTVADGVASALQVLHRNGIVHRDVKPENILLRTTTQPVRQAGRLAGLQVMLGDLGIAKDLQWASGLTSPAGSPAFMAPEQRDPTGRVTPASDVHALAMTVAALLALRPPWPATTVGELLARGTAADPQDRTATAADLAAQLRTALAPPAPAAPPAAPSVTPTGRRPVVLGRRTVAGLTAGAATLVAVGVGAWTLLGPPRLTLTDTSASSGGMSVEVPRGWDVDEVAGVSFPGADDPQTGVRAAAGTRSVTLAADDVTDEPVDVLDTVVAQALDAPAAGDCAQSGYRQVRVGTWSGLAKQLTGCADDVVVDEVVLDLGDSGTVWVEVRSVDGTPDVAAVLGSLDVP